MDVVTDERAPEQILADVANEAKTAFNADLFFEWRADNGEPEYRAWSMKSGTPGMGLIHLDQIEAAASEPLVDDDDDLAFEPKSFFKRVLKIAETHGEG